MHIWKGLTQTEVMASLSKRASTWWRSWVGAGVGAAVGHLGCPGTCTHRALNVSGHGVACCNGNAMAVPSWFQLFEPSCSRRGCWWVFPKPCVPAVALSLCKASCGAPLCVEDMMKNEVRGYISFLQRHPYRPWGLEIVVMAFSVTRSGNCRSPPASAACAERHHGRWCDRRSVILSISVGVHFTHYSTALFKGNALLNAVLLGMESRSLPAIPAALRALFRMLFLM